MSRIRKRTKGEIIFQVFNYLMMVFLCVVMLYPYLNQLALSFNEASDSVYGGITIFPREFTLDNYKAIFANTQFQNAVLISVLRVVAGTVLSLVVVSGAAYATSKKYLPYRNAIIWILMIPGYITAGIIPIYIVYRYLGLLNNFLVYILPTAFVFYNMIIIKTFFDSLPAELEEAALLDGASEIQILARIVFPLSAPVMATVALWVAVGHWNDWTTTLYYVDKKTLQPLQYLLMQVIKESETVQQMAQEAARTGQQVQTASFTTPESIKTAVFIVATVPIIMVYPFLQKYFMQGIMLGAVKS